MSANVPDGAITSAKIAPGAITNTHIANNSIGSAQLTDILTLRTLNLGSINWDGNLNVYAKPTGGGFGTTGDLRARLSGLATNGMLELFGDTGFPAFRAYATGDGGAVRLEDDAGLPAVTLGALHAGGILSVWRPGGNLGVSLSGGEPTDVGGEVTLYHSDAGGFSKIGVFLDGNSTASGGELSVRDVNGLETIELLGSTSSGQGSLLTMLNGLGSATVSIDADASGRGSAFSLLNGTNTTSVFLDGNSGGAGLIQVRNNSGFNRVDLDGQAASGGGEVLVRDAGGTATVRLFGAQTSTTGARIELYQANGVRPTAVLDGEGNTGGSFLELYKTDGTRTIWMDADDAGEGRISTQVLEITGGSDFSENFEIQSPEAQPGMIVKIDALHPGELAVSDRAYDRTVAGVVSGAGGVKPGLTMGQRGTLVAGRYPVALTGRVYCLVDAERGAIVPGDLITTSATPGYGMKVNDYPRAQGAVIGKAMSGLSSGRGLVLLLVSLQ